MSTKFCLRCRETGKVLCHLCGGEGYRLEPNGSTIPCIVCDGDGEFACDLCSDEPTEGVNG